MSYPQDPAILTRDQLVQATKDIQRARSNEGLTMLGRLLAELHDRVGLSWYQIESETGVPRSSAHRIAEPFLVRDDGIF